MEDSQAGRWHKRLRGKSARLVVTMGMPAVVYRVWFRAHGVKGIERNVLAFCGFRPIREDLIGMVEETSGKRRAKWLARMRQRGERGE
jgi:putative NADPH-quinone reductase